VTGGLLVVGLGNAWRRDDGAGPAVARALGGDPRVLVH
jgi:Ni,Fe-hydrogenase maturation factor